MCRTGLFLFLSRIEIAYQSNVFIDIRVKRVGYMSDEDSFFDMLSGQSSIICVRLFLKPKNRHRRMPFFHTTVSCMGFACTSQNITIVCLFLKRRRFSCIGCVNHWSRISDVWFILEEYSHATHLLLNV